MAISKSSANVVKSDDSTYRVSKGIVRSSRRTGYWAPKNELFHTFHALFYESILSQVPVTVYSGKTGRYTFVATRDGLNGLRIGCHKFDAKNTKKLAKLVDCPSEWIKQYWPTATQAAAAGR